MLSSSAWNRLALVNILIPIASLIFAKGFFPYKHFIPGHATFQNSSRDDAAPALFDKIIFMVVDALRRSVSRSMK